MIRTIILLAFLFCQIQIVAAQDRLITFPAVVYDSLHTLLLSGQTDVDYATMRIAYVATDHYNPYDLDSKEQRTRMLKALYEDADYEAASEVADSMLVGAYVDFEAHLVKLIAADKTGNTELAQYHEAIVTGLVGALFAGRDGRSEDAALQVLSTDEEYSLLRLMGLALQEQSLIECAGAPCDLMQVEDPESGETYDLYFDITYPMQHLTSELKPKR